MVNKEDIESISPETSLGHMGSFMDMKTLALQLLQERDEAVKRIEELELKLLWVQRYFQEVDINDKMADFIDEVFSKDAEARGVRG